MSLTSALPYTVLDSQMGRLSLWAILSFGTRCCRLGEFPCRGVVEVEEEGEMENDLEV